MRRTIARSTIVPFSLVLCVLVAPLACSSGGDAGEASGNGDATTGETTGEMTGESAAEATARDHIRLFEGDTSRDVPLSGEATGAIVDYLCHCIEKQDLVLRVAPVTESIEAIKSAARGIEVILASPRELQAGNTGQVLAPTRLLVPLTGPYGGAETNDRLTIFHGAPDYSQLPIYVVSGRDSLEVLLASHGVE
jgi:hypothetical protein